MVIRCFNCKKKLGVMNFVCNYCNEDCCIGCRIPEKHQCVCLQDRIDKELEQLEKKLNSAKERSKSEHFGVK